MQTYTREAQRACRQDLQARRDPGYGMVDSPKNHTSSVGTLGQTSAGSFCNTSKQQAPHLCVSNPRSGSILCGCPVPRLDEHVCIRLSTNGDPKSSPHQDSERDLPGDSNSSFLDKPSMVPESIRSTSGLAQGHSTSSSTVETATVQHLPSTSRSIQPTCMDVVSKCFEERGFSSKVAQRMARPQKDSSIKVYDSKWAIFSNWCNRRHRDPFEASISEVADFFNHLHEDKKCAFSTIEGYRAAIGQVLRIKSGIDLSTDFAITRLMANLKRHTAKPRNLMPSWDLAAVLEALKEGPFEPLRKADLKWVTLKTVFLIALASGKRRGELHSLRFDSFSRTENWSRITLRPDPAFISKTDLAGQQQRVLKPIIIEAIRFAEGHVKDRDRTLCPVRALKIYLRRTSDLREGKDKLFIAFKKGHKGDIVKNTVSFWIRKTIYSAYNEAPEVLKKKFRIRAHDVRALASSWAFLQNISLDNVMDACSWKSRSTFIRHYLRDMTEISGNLNKLGPIISAQHQV